VSSVCVERLGSRVEGSSQALLEDTLQQLHVRSSLLSRLCMVQHQHVFKLLILWSVILVEEE
jgi:hypothetical protein